MSKALEEGTALELDFGKLQKIAATGSQVVPVAVQHADTHELILIAYANDLALKHTIACGNATFWSTSRNELWEKGATSGETFEILEIRVNCEQNSLLYMVRPVNSGVCHTVGSDGTTRPSCYYRAITDASSLRFVDDG